MSNADSSSTRLAYVAESTENSIPATPSWQNLRFTSESLNYSKLTTSSEEIRSDGNVPDLTEVGHSVAGDIGFELTYGTLDSLLEGVLFSSWSSDIIKNGTTASTFAFEKTFEQGATDAYMRYTGCKVNSLELVMRARERITGTMNIMGRSHTTDTAALSGATYAAGNTNSVMTGSNDIGSLSLSGVSPSPTLMSASVKFGKSLREQIAIANGGAIGIGSGRYVVTGSIEAYFADLTLYNLFKNHTSTSISATLGSVSTEKYTLLLPETKLFNGRIETPGNDQDIMARFDFQSIYSTAGSPAYNSSIHLTRAVS